MPQYIQSAPSSSH